MCVCVQWTISVLLCDTFVRVHVLIFSFLLLFLVGSYKTSLIASCREAIKQKNFAQLFKSIEIISED